MKIIKLNECEKGIVYTIDSISCLNKPVSRRLTELGFIQGSKLKIIQFSALKKTLLVEIEGYILSLRANIAEFVKVIKMEE